ncbi:hypothetical protein JAAARDRAFT_50167 [Jaapia argillacea MUCL 33604]|uniref:NADAR domain-containing protein n=1 Tax=Jaapia argillacea MUCL 33604 TaxID=933084 RepID=A0A067PN96_9AGAM|nr:hypothetical protein JAAARDRAFT_50167 [Jaapia argillacea MUCL 33604]
MVFQPAHPEKLFGRRQTYSTPVHSSWAPIVATPYVPPLIQCAVTPIQPGYCPITPITPYTPVVPQTSDGWYTPKVPYPHLGTQGPPIPPPPEWPVPTVVPPGPRNGPRASRNVRRIYFYHKHQPYYGFTNFSPHPIFCNGKRYPTSEHFFQSQKFLPYRPDIAEYIRTCSERPREALKEARKYQQDIRSDWHHVNIGIMMSALRLKFDQHPDLQRELLSTRNAELIENARLVRPSRIPTWMSSGVAAKTETDATNWENFS